MSLNRISGQSIDFNMDGDLIHAEKVSLSITDNTTVAQTKGVPDGVLPGDVSAEGEIELTPRTLKIITAKARTAGSWRGIDTVDLMWYAKAGDEEMKIEAFGCKLNVSDLLDVDPKGGAAVTHKIKFIVASKDFVRINGIPYLEATLTDPIY